MVNLSQTESCIASRVRAKQQTWARRRWYIVCGGLFIMAMGIWLLLQIAELAWYMVLQGVMMWVGTLVKWRGDDVAILLLKLMEERTASGAVSGNQ
jgi:hypothetical protein